MLTNPSFMLRAAYCLVLLGFILPTGVSLLATWGALAGGRWTFAAASVVLTLMMAILGAVRLYLVVRYPTALCSPRLSRGAAWVRRIGVVLLYIGLLANVLEWSAGPVVRMLMSGRADSGGAFILLAFFLGMVKMAGTSGLIVFEFSRLLGFEKLAFDHANRQHA